MDKWSTLRMIMEFDLQAFEEAQPGDGDEEFIKFAEHAAKVITIYLNVMTDLDKDEHDGGNKVA